MKLSYKAIIPIVFISMLAFGCNTASQTQPTTAPTANTINPVSNSQLPAPVTPATQNPATAGTGQTSTAPASDSAEAQGAVDGEMNEPQVYAVNILSTGFVPTAITIDVNDYIQFVNQDTIVHTPISKDIGGFGPTAAVAIGKYYRYQFKTAGTFTITDAQNSKYSCIVTVK